MSEEENESELTENDETHLFDWIVNDVEEQNVKRLLASLSSSQMRQVLYLAGAGERNLLHLSAESGSAANLKILVDSIRDLRCEETLDRKCSNGMTPLHYAAKAHNQACVRLLVEAGANVNAVNLARNTPLHLASLNFHSYFVPSLNAKSYATIKYLAGQPDTNLGVLNMDGKTPLSISPNYWIQHIAWDKSLRCKLEDYKLQVAQSKALVTQWKYFSGSKPIQQLTEITCPRPAGFDQLVDCKLLTGCFFDDDSAQNIVSIKVVDPGNTAHMREIDVLNLLRSELSETAKRLVNINLGNTSGTVEYLVFPYIALDLNSFLHGKSDIVVGLAYQAIRALAVVHSANVMHGDIKPHNFAVRVHQHSHFRIVLGNFDYAVQLSEKRSGRAVSALYPAETDYLKYEHPWVSPEVYRAKCAADADRGNRIRPSATLAIDVFSLGLILGVAADSDCCRDRGKRMYERRDLERVLTSQLDLTMQFRAARCRDDALAKRLLVCATNMMCLIDPLQRCRLDDILREIDM